MKIPLPARESAVSGLCGVRIMSELESLKQMLCEWECAGS